MTATSLRGSTPPSSHLSDQDTDLISLKRVFHETPDGQCFDKYYDCMPSIGDQITGSFPNEDKRFTVTGNTTLNIQFGETIPSPDGLTPSKKILVKFPLLHVQPLN